MGKEIQFTERQMKMYKALNMEEKLIVPRFSGKTTVLREFIYKALCRC